MRKVKIYIFMTVKAVAVTTFVHTGVIGLHFVEDVLVEVVHHAPVEFVVDRAFEFVRW